LAGVAPAPLFDTQNGLPPYLGVWNFLDGAYSRLWSSRLLNKSICPNAKPAPTGFLAKAAVEPNQVTYACSRIACTWPSCIKILGPRIDAAGAYRLGFFAGGTAPSWSMRRPGARKPETAYLNNLTGLAPETGGAGYSAKVRGPVGRESGSPSAGNQARNRSCCGEKTLWDPACQRQPDNPACAVA